MLHPNELWTTERLILRRWQESDHEPFSRMNADPRVMKFFPAPVSRQESDAMVDRIEAHFGVRELGVWAAELRQGKSFIGFIGLNVIRGTLHTLHRDRLEAGGGSVGARSGDRGREGRRPI